MCRESVSAVMMVRLSLRPWAMKPTFGLANGRPQASHSIFPRDLHPHFVVSNTFVPIVITVIFIYLSIFLSLMRIKLLERVYLIHCILLYCPLTKSIIIVWCGVLSVYHYKLRVNVGPGEAECGTRGSLNFSFLTPKHTGRFQLTRRLDSCPHNVRKYTLNLESNFFLEADN